jgi:hypothetical protein
MIGLVKNRWEKPEFFLVAYRFAASGTFRLKNPERKFDKRASSQAAPASG